MKTKHAPYSLYKKKVGTKQFWYARFWDASKKSYTSHRALGIEVGGKKERRGEAASQAQAMLPSIIFSATHMTLVQYLSAFWDRTSPYFREQETVQNRRLSQYYIKASQDIIRLHIAPYPPFRDLPAV